jgi:isoleucyl-tRNA synthetase
LHAVSDGLFGRNSFKNVIVTGTIAGSDGRKMSKSYGNYTDPNELMDKYSADALRFLFLSSPLLNGEDFSLQDKDVSDAARKLGMVWNMYDFFTLYASVDGWEWDGKLEDPYQQLTHPLDQWIVSRVHELTAEVDKHMAQYDIPNALKGVLPFIDDASNWYIRRSRKRFWKSQNDADKKLAYKTLHYLLVRLSLILAPITPFMAEELYRSLTGRDSVHLCDWPPDGQVNGIIINQIAQVREIISQGLAQRAEAGIKVRQPLEYVAVETEHDIKSLSKFDDMIAEELNVKRVSWGQSPKEYNEVILQTELTPELIREGKARELIRHIQQARKQAGLNVDDRIDLLIQSDSEEVMKAFDDFKAQVYAETLTVGELKQAAEYQTDIKIDGQAVRLEISKK